MTRYAVKIGEIHLRSDRPITWEDRERAALELLKRGSAPLITMGGDLFITVTVTDVRNNHE